MLLVMRFGGDSTIHTPGGITGFPRDHGGRWFNQEVSSLNRRALAIAILAAFVAFLDGTVINVALPAITAELGGGLPVQQWVVDAYLITLGGRSS